MCVVAALLSQPDVHQSAPTLKSVTGLNRNNEITVYASYDTAFHMKRVKEFNN